MGTVVRVHLGIRGASVRRTLTNVRLHPVAMRALVAIWPLDRALPAHVHLGFRGVSVRRMRTNVPRFRVAIRALVSINPMATAVHVLLDIRDGSVKRTLTNVPLLRVAMRVPVAIWLPDRALPARAHRDTRVHSARRM